MITALEIENEWSQRDRSEETYPNIIYSDLLYIIRTNRMPTCILYTTRIIILCVYTTHARDIAYDNIYPGSTSARRLRDGRATAVEVIIRDFPRPRVQCTAESNAI